MFYHNCIELAEVGQIIAGPFITTWVHNNTAVAFLVHFIDSAGTVEPVSIVTQVKLSGSTNYNEPVNIKW